MNGDARRAARGRGQSTVEMALGLMVFVTVLVFGMHFAEVGFLSIKVQEASAGALWDTTARRMHTLPKDFAPLQTAMDQAGAQAQQRYQDFDGRTSREAGNTTTQVFTRGAGLTVTCNPEGSIRFSFGPAKLGGVYDDQLGGFRCGTQAAISPSPGFPHAFMQQFFRAMHYEGPTAINVCSAGRAQGGTCRGEYGILLDDWGFSDAAHGENCPLAAQIDSPGTSCGQNPHLYRSVQTVYDAYKGPANTQAATRLAEQTVGASPLPDSDGELGFFMSFTGSNWGDPFFDRVPPGEGERRWAVSAVYSPVAEYGNSYNMRGTCWLGLGCGYNH